MKTKLTAFLFLLVVDNVSSQHLNLGITFQYLPIKQVKVNASHLIPQSSFNYYNVTDNRWKFAAAGQSYVIGTVVQLDIKRFYIALEPSFELNTYDYYVDYPLTPTSSEKVKFKTLFTQVDAPLYVGYQFKTSDFFRYSFYAGVGPVFPTHLEPSVQNENKDPSVGARYYSYDMQNILYTNKPYWNALAGFGIHFASLGRLDIRYVSRLGSPGNQYVASFSSLGIGLTFFLPLHLLKKKIYYVD